jgi:membrane protein DedA with SNARE-associated domain
VEDLLTVLADWCQKYGYPVLFAFVMLENAGIPIPGETAVLVGGFLASRAGGHRFHLGVVILITLVAAVLGDNLGYWVGRRWARPYLQRGQTFLVLTPRALKAAETYFARFGGWTIFFARFITGVRVFGALAAGSCGMPWRRFLMANVSGAVAWATIISLLGFVFGESLTLLAKWLGRAGLIAALAFVILLVVGYSWRRWRRRLIKEPQTASQHSNQCQVEHMPDGPKT